VGQRLTHLWHSRSSTLRKAAIEAFVMNGVVFLGTVLLLETFYNHPHNHFLGCPYRVSNQYGVFCSDFAFLWLKFRRFWEDILYTWSALLSTVVSTRELQITPTKYNKIKALVDLTTFKLLNLPLKLKQPPHHLSRTLLMLYTKCCFMLLAPYSSLFCKWFHTLELPSHLSCPVGLYRITHSSKWIAVIWLVMIASLKWSP
jgi:hypothetical protein